MDFSDIPVRAPGTADISWWNSLRTAGLRLQQFLGFGAGGIPATLFAFANGQGSAANVTGLVFASGTCKSAWAWISVRRQTASAIVVSEVELWLSYDPLNATWVLQDQVEHGTPSGFTFSVTSVGQVQYTSDTLAGTGYADTSYLKALTTA